MKTKLATILAMSLLVPAASAFADDREFSDTELAACVALVEAQNVVVAARESREAWMDDLEPRVDTERERIAYNQHVETYNELNRVIGKFDDVWNANCKGTLRRSVYERVCQTPTGRMQRFLKDSDGCADWARRFGE